MHNLSNTWNFVIHPEWIKEERLKAIISVNDWYRSPGVSPTPVEECFATEVGHCETNNILVLHLHFQPRPHLILNSVYMHVKGDFEGRHYEDVYPETSQVAAVVEELNVLYPMKIEASYRADITVRPWDDDGDLLDQVEEFVEDWINDQYLPNVDFMGYFPPGDFEGNRAGSLANVEAHVAWAKVSNPLDVAHELGHNIGFDHWTCVHNESDDCESFPIFHGGIGGIGTDIQKWRIIMPQNTDCAWGHAHDFMTYGDCQWVSTYTYEILLNHPTVASYDVIDPPALLVRGHIDPDGTTTLKPLYLINATGPIVDTVPHEDELDTVYTIQGYDPKHNTLFVHNFEPRKLMSQLELEGLSLNIKEAVPYFDNLNVVELRRGSQVLATISDPSNGVKPEVRIVEPRPGDDWSRATNAFVRWNASSPAGAPLLAKVQFSPDNGRNLVTLGRDVNATELEINPEYLPGSEGIFFVQVTDGINIATARSEAIRVPVKAPEVRILQPAGEIVVPSNVPLQLTGLAFTRNNEVISDDSYIWSSDISGKLGTGSQLIVANMTAGVHNLTLTATDDSGRSGSDTVKITISQTIPEFQNHVILLLVFVAILSAVMIPRLKGVR